MVPEQTCTKRRSSKTHCWLSAAAMEAKRVRRRLERRWLHTQREEDRVAYRKSCRTANKLITDSLEAKNTEIINEAAGSSRTLWKAVNSLLHPPSSEPPSESEESCFKRCSDISSFFRNKVLNIKNIIAARLDVQSDACETDPTHSGEKFENFENTTPDEVRNMINAMKSKYSPVDVIPSSIIKLCPDIFGAIISRLANMSFDQCTFPTSYKSAQIRPLLKKPCLDPNDPVSYRPI